MYLQQGGQFAQIAKLGQARGKLLVVKTDQFVTVRFAGVDRYGVVHRVDKIDRWRSPQTELEVELKGPKRTVMSISKT